MPTPLKKINEVMAGLLQAQSFTASMGSLPDDSVWATAAPKVLNGNTILIQPGPASNQIVLKESALVMTVPLAGFVEIEVVSDFPINGVTSIPVGARNDGTNYFFSEFTTWMETPVMLSGKFNHVYAVYDSAQPGNLAVAVISNNSISDPNPALLVNLGVTVSDRQAVCYVGLDGDVTMLQTFPAMFNTVATVVSDAPTDFIDWAQAVNANRTNAIYAQFTFPAGIGTGAIGELGVKMGPDFVAFLAISPQLLKDADVPLVLKWSLMIGEPGAFL